MSFADDDRKRRAKLETLRHIEMVQRIVFNFNLVLFQRACEHDRSKLEHPEVDVFAEYTDKLRGTTYDSPEYRELLKKMKPALDHHYANNRHHPEYFDKFTSGKNDTPISRMNILDLVEMICDWKAASLRHADGDLKRSIEANAKRFKITKQLKQILLNSIDLLEL